MFKFIIICAFLATANAIRQDYGHHGHNSYVSKHVVASSDDAHAKVFSDVRADGFDYHLETSNGISSKASGDESGRIHGNFQWISPEGEHVSLNYVADENGYQPDSAILPTPHPIPEAILKSLEYNEKHPYQEEETHAQHFDHHHSHHNHQSHHIPQHHHQEKSHHYHHNRRF